MHGALIDMRIVDFVNFLYYLHLGCKSDYFGHCTKPSEDLEEYTLYGWARLEEFEVMCTQNTPYS